MNWLFYKERRY